MIGEQQAFLYFDLLAKALSLLKISECDFGIINAIKVPQSVTTSVRHQLEKLKKETVETFLKKLEIIIKQAEKEELPLRYIKLIEIIRWMDMYISYDKKMSYPRNYCVAVLVPSNGTTATIIKSLNRNYKETRIWINPKFEIRPAFDAVSKRRRPASNRDAFAGLNGELKNCAYFEWDGTTEIRNIILSSDKIIKDGKEYIRVGFSPLSCEKNLVNSYPLTISRMVGEKKVKISGFSCELGKQFCDMSKRLSADFEFASAKKVDILFMPEMLGTSESCGKGKSSIKWMNELYGSLMQKGEKAPYITVLPSYWNNNSNSCTVAKNNGDVLGVQEKHEPYREVGEDGSSKQEALNDFKTKEYLIIHIRNVHRLAVIICSEYLADSYIEWGKLLCSSLGVSLILVPSFSKGENDFLMAISRLIEYDTTVIWGNCCGAAMSEAKVIGGCAVAGSTSVIKFGNKCKCNNSCNGIKACVFTVDLPLELLIDKMNKNAGDKWVHHFLNKK